jgi:endonuclease/exonuclease/phosphatase family metal-dependent hydrolase
VSREKTVSILSYNIHKGFNSTKRRFVLNDIRESLKHLDPDIVFLQEVQGEHSVLAQRVKNWPELPQSDFLAAESWPHLVYGRNRSYRVGHHGNAILSKFPIATWSNTDISAHQFEGRGLLHAVINWPFFEEPLHAVCVHLGLTGRGRDVQIGKLCEFVQEHVPASGPLIVAGDFNDWSLRASKRLSGMIHAAEVFHRSRGRHARTFPAWLPLLHLDRVYCRGFSIEQVGVIHTGIWRQLSDHAALTAVLKIGS